MKGQQFNALISGFSVGYILMQIPSCVHDLPYCVLSVLDSRRNVLLSQFTRPSVYLSCNVFVWGVISIRIGQ